MRRQFEENFVKIRPEFDKAFHQLFGSGHDKLELVERRISLEAGVTSSPSRQASCRT